MLNIKPVKQTKGYCGPACLKMVLSYYGINKSMNNLAKLTKTTRDKGCYEKEIINTAKLFGLKGFVKQNSSINELKNLIKKNNPVIVDWFSPEECGHYSVVVGFDKHNILILDPHFGELKKYNIDWFEERWFDMPFSKKIIKKEIIVIHI